MLRIDATSFDPPSDACVLFLFNPFDEVIMARVAARVVESYKRNPRPIFIVYYNPWYRDVLDRAGGLRLIAEGDFGDRSVLLNYYAYAIYRVEAAA